MATCRPCVSIYSPENGEVMGSTLMPRVFTSPLRPDLVRYVHTNMAKNKRQAYGVSENSGYQTSAMSWGTGRAVARIPRVQGGGTHRAGQAAFGNFCRDGGMFAPTKVWRRWHRKINKNEKRYAVCTALAASSLTPIVMARGHHVDNIPELPLVVNDSVEKFTKTKQALAFLKKCGCIYDIEKIKNTKKIRAGVGKIRNKRYNIKKGPLIIYNEDNGLKNAFKNIPGIDLCHVNRLNLLQLAPGGTLGRLIIWTSSAFQKLKHIYNGNNAVKKCTTEEKTDDLSSCSKNNYTLPRSLMKNADISRIINSDEIQSSIRPSRMPNKRATQKKNPLKNHAAMCKINPLYSSIKKNAKKVEIPGTSLYSLIKRKNKATKLDAKKHRKTSKKFFKEIVQAFDEKREQELNKE